MIKDCVIKALSQYDMLRFGRHITVALSGGADSVSLLHILLSLKNDLCLNITAAHYNHNIRGDEALRDQHFVEDLCAAWGVKLYVGSGNVLDFAKEKGISIELAARELRYAFFDTIDTDCIATAHTLSDNLETVILNLTRGTGISGFCGIPPVRDRYIRPIINATRLQVEEYCNQNNLSFITDSTNLQDDYTRNNIRHNIIPLLKEINPSLEVTVSRTVDSLREDASALNDIAAAKYNILENGRLDVSLFSSLDIAICKRIIKKYYTDMCGNNPDNSHINSIYDITMCGGKCSIPCNKSAVCKDGELYFIDNNKMHDILVFDVQIAKSDDLFYKNTLNVHNLFLKNVLDCDKIVGNLTVRTRMAGDSIKLARKNGTKTLKKLYTEYKIPLNIRETLPIICDNNGVVWIYGIGVADRCRVDENTKKIYNITVNKTFLGDSNEKG